MEFTYNAEETGVWNPAEHDYDGATPAGWTFEESANEITVTNHSNTGITAGFTYQQDTSWTNINGKFKNNNSVEISSFDIETAENTKVNEAPTATITLELSGAFANNESTIIGSVVVTISDSIVDGGEEDAGDPR